MAKLNMLRASSTDTDSSTLSCITVGGPSDSARSSIAASTTPPTSMGETASTTSDAPKSATGMADTERPRSSRARQSITTYNDKILAGTAVHTRKSFLPPQQSPQLSSRTLSDEIIDPPVSVAGPAADTKRAPEPEPEASSEQHRRSSRPRASIATYNDKVLAGTAVHTRRAFLPQHDASRTVSGETLVNGIDEPREKLLGDGIKALDLEWQVDSILGATDGMATGKEKKGKGGRFSVGALLDAAASATTSLGKRGREAVESGKDRLSALKGGRRDSLRLRGVEGKSQDDDEPAKKRSRLSAVSVSSVSTFTPEVEQKRLVKTSSMPKRKKWLDHGLWLGQERGFDPTIKPGKRSSIVKPSSVVENRVLPLPMFAGEKLLQGERDFLLPFDIYHPEPLGRGEKPKDWKARWQNNFAGDAASYWKKSKALAPSKCLCTVESGCDEDCQNRYMQYECDESNCNIGPEYCTNRSFAELKKRTEKRLRAGFAEPTRNPYDVGVEVMKTSNRGYGVRAVRTFEPGQIIVEYAGEIITQEECDRRMNEEYKDKKDYYLMTFHNNMIIDATCRGSIARFVNHSCEPNCRIDKWIVNGQPRMALFAGDNGILTGEELTYDYNFDPFSDDNVQACHCGTASCRGFLGPKPKETSRSKAKESLVAGAKRKLQQVFSSKDASDTETKSSKKRKFAAVARSALTKTKAHLTHLKPAADPPKLIAQNDSRDQRAARRSSSSVTLASSSPGVIAKRGSTSSLTSVTSSPRSPARPTSPPTKKLHRLAASVKKHTAAIKSASKTYSRRSLPAARALTQSTLPFEPLKLDFLDSHSPTSNNEKLESAKGGDLLRRSDSAVRPPTATAPRPLTASSIRSAATSMKANVVRSVRGQRRAAAVARMGLLGENVSDQTIRMIFPEGE